MQKLKVAIFTKGEKHPLHPRISLEIDLLKANNFEVELFCPESNSLSFKAKIKRSASFSMFEWGIVEEFQEKVRNYDIIIIYDTQLLPLSQFRAKNQLVIFETLDDNVELIVYHFGKKLPFFKFLSNTLRSYLKGLEQKYLSQFVDKTIVNSSRLGKVFKKQNAVINFYASPFEGKLNQLVTANLPPAFLYLGKISLDKGLKAMLHLAEKNQIPIYLFGNLESGEKTELQNLIEQSARAVYRPKMDIETLGNELENLNNKHRLIGLSLIQSVHISYQFQDANKDIDYLALGIPFIGNERPTTKKILDAKCGALVTEEEQIQELLHNQDFYFECAKNCINHYQHNFSKDSFAKIFLAQIN